MSLLRTARALLAVTLVAMAPACTAGAGAGSDTLSVVVAENPWTDLVEAVGGDRVAVTTILSDPEVDPHLYSADVRVARAVAQASLVVRNGLGYDDFVRDLVDASPRENRTVVVAADAMSAGSTGSANPHLWYDLPRVPAMVDAVAGALADLDPDGAAGYRRRAQEFTASLQPLLQRLDDLAARTGDAGRRPQVASTEPVAQYLLSAAGFDDVTPEAFTRAVQNESEPPAEAVARLQDLVRSGNLVGLVYNTQTTDRLTEAVRSLAQDERLPVVEVTETVPDGTDYVSWQLEHLDALEQALR